MKQTGIKAWIEAQLAPASGEDKALAARLASIETLAMSTEELREKYEIPPNVRQEIQKVRAEREEAAEKANVAESGGSADAPSPAVRGAMRQ